MTLAFRCGHSHSLARCSTTGCNKPASVLCRYPVKNRRTGRTTACNRFVCTGCASADKLCPPHARGVVAGKVDPLITICSACFTLSCVAGEMPCERRGSTRQVTVAQWKTLISFGVL